MEVKISYSKIQLEKAVKFIGNNNRHFLGKFDEIRNSILQTMKDLAKQFPNAQWIGTMGYYVMVDVSSIEDMDNDENHIFCETLIDPSIGESCYLNRDDISNEIYQFSSKQEIKDQL